MRKCVFFAIAVILLITAPPAINAHQEGGCSKGAEWGPTVEKLLHKFKQIKTEIDDDSPCNYFVARALYAIYKLKDFNRPGNASSPYYDANEIIEEISTKTSAWVPMGKADDPEVLKEAQEQANALVPVVAVEKGEGHGHIAIIIPGSLKQSRTWKHLFPCSACFFYRKPWKSYVGLPLSYAFGNPSKAVIYRRIF